MLFLVETATDSCPWADLKVLLGFVKSALTIVQIIIPIMLIIWGTIDLGKAVVASKEEEIKKSQQILAKRAIAAVIVFLLATIVGFLMGFVGNDSWKSCWTGSTKCVGGIDPITGDCKVK